MKPPKAFAVLPTLLTLANGACGFAAITIAAKVGPETMGNDLTVAALLIIMGMLFDMLDGTAARWTNQQSEFGAQLDSLCDAVTFGAAPAFLTLQFTKFYLEEGYKPLIEEFPPRLLFVIAVLYMLCTILRLARFNVETEEDDAHDSFTGLPSPAAAGVIASFPIAFRGLEDFATHPNAIISSLATWAIPTLMLVLPLMTLTMGVLMVSKIPYRHINTVLRGKGSRTQMLQILFSLGIVFLFQELALAIMFGYFAFAEPLRWSLAEFLGLQLFGSDQAGADQNVS